MAIDMIENNELSALAPSRLGLKEFTDDSYKNYTGDQEFYNLFGSRTRKKSAIREAVRVKYIDLPTDCLNIQRSIDIVSNDIETLLKQKSNLNQREALDETNIILGEFKSKSLAQNCEQILAKQEQERSKKETLDTLVSLSDISVGKAQSELSGIVPSGQGVNTNKILIYGGVGIVVLVGIALILRK
jgi:hypothetical protein